MTPEWLKRNRTYVFMSVLFLAVIMGVMYLMRRETPREISIFGSTASAASAFKPISITINGAVQQPGTLQLPADARVADALDKAGIRPDADLSKLVLAKKLQNGDKLTIPSRAPIVSKDAPSAAGSAQPAQTPVSAALVAPSGKINLNTAMQAELESLPGIGPALAQRILDYRAEIGKFTTIEELQEVRGIGDVIFSRLEELVTVE